VVFPASGVSLSNSRPFSARSPHSVPRGRLREPRPRLPRELKTSGRHRKMHSSKNEVEARKDCQTRRGGIMKFKSNLHDRLDTHEHENPRLSRRGFFISHRHEAWPHTWRDENRCPRTDFHTKLCPARHPDARNTAANSKSPFGYLSPS
jgi:hypothetical protein